MTKPISIKVDSDVGDAEAVAYIRYSSAGRSSGYSLDPDGAVNVDLAADGCVIGIELLALDDYTWGLAREIAGAHSLWLPATAGELLPS